VRQVKDFEAKLKDGSANVSMDILLFLKKWLVGHINGTDKKYSRHFNDNGIR